MNKRDANKILKSLQREYPLGDIKVTLELMPGKFKTVEGCEVNGHVRGCAETNSCHIQVNANYGELSAPVILAHEYRHIMQWVVEDLVWLDKDKESDAHKFGTRFVRKYFGFSGSC